jgi:ribokinase
MTGAAMLEPRFDVIVCGSLHLDIILDAPHLPRLDETVTGHAWHQVCGGKGGNQAVQAARQGSRSAMIGRVGMDDFGARLTANLDTAGVDRSAVAVDSAARSGMSAAIVDSNGDYGAVIVPGANLAIDPADIAGFWRQLGGGRILILQNEVPHPVNVAAAKVARAAGARVVFNAAPARPSGSDLLDLVDVLIVNKVEAEMFSGSPVSDRRTALGVLPLLASVDRTVIVTLGSGGLVIGAPGTPPLEIAAIPVNVVSTHGAGDCFVGALASRLAAGYGMVEASRFANAVAARYVSGDRTARS